MPDMQTIQHWQEHVTDDFQRTNRGGLLVHGELEDAAKELVARLSEIQITDFNSAATTTDNAAAVLVAVNRISDAGHRYVNVLRNSAALRRNLDGIEIAKRHMAELLEGVTA